MNRRCCFAIIVVLTGFAWISVERSFAAPELEGAKAIKPASDDGRALNLDFEDGTLKDWTATGDAFEGQPVKGDAVFARRSDMQTKQLQCMRNSTSTILAELAHNCGTGASSSRGVDREASTANGSRRIVMRHLNASVPPRAAPSQARPPR